MNGKKGLKGMRNLKIEFERITRCFQCHLQSVEENVSAKPEGFDGMLDCV